MRDSTRKFLEHQKRRLETEIEKIEEEKMRTQQLMDNIEKSLEIFKNQLIDVEAVLAGQ